MAKQSYHEELIDILSLPCEVIGDGWEKEHPIIGPLPCDKLGRMTQYWQILEQYHRSPKLGWQSYFRVCFIVSRLVHKLERDSKWVRDNHEKYTGSDGVEPGITNWIEHIIEQMTISFTKIVADLLKRRQWGTTIPPPWEQNHPSESDSTSSFAE